MRLNDLDFHVEIDGQGQPLLLLHGFTGSVRSWDRVRPALAAEAQVISIDLIGHGFSAAPEDATRYTLDWATRDLVALLDQLQIRAADVLGYSMGGRVALHLALAAPERVRKLILESASPGLEDVAERERRKSSDAALAERIERNGIPAFVAEWERQPLLEPAPHVSPDVRAEQRKQRMNNTAAGLANSLRGMGAGQQMPLWSHLSSLDVPTLLIAGALDSRYEQIARRAGALLPASELWIAPDAGHTVHLDQPEHFAKHVTLALDNKLTHRAARC